MGETRESKLAAAIHHLPPGYFALVMATGIISLGFHLEGYHLLSLILLWIAGAAYAVLLVMSLWRGIRYPRAIMDDFAGPRNGFSFFTFVAGTNVLGARLATEGTPMLPAVMLGVAFVAWLLLGYVIPGRVITKHQNDDILASINGTWFIWCVGSQSVAVLAAALEPTAGVMGNALSIISVLSWGIGVILYAVIGIAIVIRLLTRGIPAEDLDPPYWVTMGAAAITVLAGSRIVEMSDTAMVTVMRDPVAAAAVVFWAFATWLIPALIGVGYWRHVSQKVPLRYTAQYWSMSFPLGMYAVAGIYLGQADNLPIVGWIGGKFLWVALAAWVIIFVWMLVHITTSWGAASVRATSARRS